MTRWRWRWRPKLPVTFRPANHSRQVLVPDQIFRSLGILSQSSMPLLRLDDVSLAYGHLPLLAHVDFQIESRERVCLVGRNGAGKTTLLRVIGGTALPDGGEVWRQDGLRIGHLEQEVPADTDQTVFEVVATGLGELGALLAEYHHLTSQAGAAERLSLKRISELHARIDALDGWNINQKVETVLTRLDLVAEKQLTDCSGGIRRQVMLARALVSEPDLLLLDEPTNHLDIAAITWLENYLFDYPRSRFSKASRDANYRVGSGKIDLFSRRLRILPAEKRRVTGNRSARGCKVRQKTR